jgi:hypothetical protein
VGQAAIDGGQAGEVSEEEAPKDHPCRKSEIELSLADEQSVPSPSQILG